MSQSLFIMIGAYYPCFRQPKAVSEILAAFRKHYPESTVVMVCDGGDHELENIANQYNAIFKYEQENLGYSGIGGLCERHSLYRWIERFLVHSAHIKDEWFMLLEDDVFTVRRVNPGILQHDMHGISSLIYLSDFLSTYLKQINPNLPDVELLPFSGFGGTIFKTSFIKSLYERIDQVKDEVDNFEQMCKERGQKHLLTSDTLLTFLVFAFGGSVGHNPEFTEASFDDTLVQVAKGNVAIINNLKYFYV